MIIDVVLLRKVMEHITAHPDEHDQDVWAIEAPCGTVACIAGHTVIMSGLTFRVDPPDDYERTHYGAVRSAEVVAETGEEVDVAAQRLLGLTDDEANALFLDADTISEIWDVVERITDGELTRPADLADMDDPAVTDEETA